MARGRRWRVLRVESGVGCSSVDLQRVGPGGGADRATLLVPFDRLVPESSSTRPRVVGTRRWLHGLRAAVAAAAPADGLQPAARARIALHAYQLEPALAVVRDGASRLLLADEVGLGKTIQAGLVIAALAARGQARRALVLVPAGLRWQWADELRDRFGLAPIVVDAEWLRRRVAGLRRGVNPWLVPGLVVASLDYVKQPEVLRSLRPVAWDVVVVDEAHAVAGPGTERGTAARQLAARARRIVLVTATPHGGSDEEFEALCGVGRHEGGRETAPILFFRRTRAEVGPRVDRRVQRLGVRLHDTERRLHDELARYVRAVWRHAPAEHRAGSRLAMIVLNKRALSSAGSLAASLERRATLLALGPTDREQLSLPLAADPVDDADGAPDEAALGVPGLVNPGRERRWLERLLARARDAAAYESKFTVLRRLMSRTREPAIVFTEYRDTLAGVAAALAPIATLAILHGGLAPRERRDALQAFGTGAARILLATDAAGEGLNLHTRCRWVLSLELPWSPRRLEQRIGRVDRIGQTRRVHAWHLVARDTAEDRLLARLARKVDCIRRQLGGGSDYLGITEEALLRAIVGRLEMPPARPAARPDAHRSGLVARADLREAGVAECERLEAVRRLTAQGIVRTAPGPTPEVPDAPALLRRTAADLDRRKPWVAVARARHPPSPLARVVRETFGLTVPRGSCLLVVRLAIDAGAGPPLDESLHAVATVMPVVKRPADAADIKVRLTSLLRHDWAWVEQRLRRQTSARSAAVLERVAARGRVELARERDLIRVLKADARRGLQPSLFDRRAERDAEDRLASHVLALDESNRRCAELERLLRCGRVVRMEPVLALLGV